MVVELPPEYAEFLESRGGPGVTKLDDRMDFMIILLDQILKQLGGTTAGSPEWALHLKSGIETLSGVIARFAGVLGLDPEQVMANPPYIRTQIKRVPSAGTAVRLPDIRIPNGFFVVIKALRRNWDSMYIGSSKADAESHTTAYDLAPGEAVDLRVSTLENLWIDAGRSNEGITWIVEQEAQY